MRHQITVAIHHWPVLIGIYVIDQVANRDLIDINRRVEAHPVIEQISPFPFLIGRFIKRIV